MSKKNKISTIFITSLILIWSYFWVSADTWKLTVTANIQSWTYDKVIKIELTPSNPSAKTFYSFNEDWWPNDALLYTWAILINRSTSLVFFSYLTIDDESKISIYDYVINYTNDIRLSTWATLENKEVKNLYVFNSWSSIADISYRMVKNDDSSIIVPENTILSSWEKFEIKWLKNSSTVYLFSPDEQKKDTVDIKELIKDTQLTNTWTQDKIENPIIPVLIENKTEIKEEPSSEIIPEIKQEVKNVSAIKPKVKQTATNYSNAITVTVKQWNEIVEKPVEEVEKELKPTIEIIEEPKPIENTTENINTDSIESWNIKIEESPELWNELTPEIKPESWEENIIEDTKTIDTPISKNNDFNNNLKASVTENSNSNNSNTWMILIVWILSLSLIWWISLKLMKKRKFL